MEWKPQGANISTSTCPFLLLNQCFDLHFHKSPVRNDSRVKLIVHSIMCSFTLTSLRSRFVLVGLVAALDGMIMYLYSANYERVLYYIE